MRQKLIITVALLSIAITAFGCASFPPGHAETRWITLIDGANGLENWTRVGDANWRAVDGAIQADKKTDKAASFLVTKDS